MFVGDPLYRPFGKKPEQVEADLLSAKSSDIEWFRLLAVNQGLASGAPEAAAAQHLEQLKETVKSPVLQEKLGELYVALGQVDKARSAFAKALELSKSPKQKQRLKTAIGNLKR